MTGGENDISVSARKTELWSQYLLIDYNWKFGKKYFAAYKTTK